MVAAAEQCLSTIEEEGGIILEKDGEYVFVHVKNKHADTPRAPTLYETDLTELKEHVLGKVAEGWKFYASFHTHPSFSPNPSNLDLSELFTGFKYNIIYSPKLDLFSFNQWVGNKSITYYIPTHTLKHLINHTNED